MTKPLRDDLMVQQQISGAWQHFVGVIMLNQTGRKPVKTVLPEFLHRWPTPEQFLTAHHNRRLRGMTQDFLTWNGEDATMLYGIGKYGSDSYEIFFKNNLLVQPTDKELLRYLQQYEQG